MLPSDCNLSASHRKRAKIQIPDHRDCMYGERFLSKNKNSESLLFNQKQLEKSVNDKIESNLNLREKEKAQYKHWKSMWYLQEALGIDNIKLRIVWAFYRRFNIYQSLSGGGRENWKERCSKMPVAVNQVIPLPENRIHARKNYIYCIYYTLKASRGDETQEHKQ